MLLTSKLVNVINNHIQKGENEPQMKKPKLIITDLDGTLLHNDKTVSEYSVSVFKKCREQGILTAVATARGHTNAEQYISSLNPDILISSGGALIKKGKDIIYGCFFSRKETAEIIGKALALTNGGCEITVDTADKHYWNYKQDPHILSPDWGEVIYTDYSDFCAESLKICVQTDNKSIVKAIAESVNDCDCARFSDGDWYKYTKSAATKVNAVKITAEKLNISLEDIAAFGDDFVDIEMLKACGIGVAVENAISEVKEIADYITDSNENDGVARFIEKTFYLCS